MNINLLNAEEVTSLRHLIDNSKKAAILCHMNADGDALGSSLAWSAYLRQQGLETAVIVPDMFPDFLQWLPGMQQQVMRYDKKTEEVRQWLKDSDLICYLDLNTTSRVGKELQPDLSLCQGKVILIDHHEQPDIKGDMTVSFPTMSSTSEMVFRLIWQLGGYDAMTKDMAVNIYCGMMTDTGAFTYNSTKPEIFLIIAYLLAKNIDKDKIYRNIYHVFSVDKLRLWGYVLNKSLKVKYPPHHASYFTLSKEDMRKYHFKKGDAEGLVNVPLKILGHKLSISLREDTEKNNLVWVSTRSVDDFPCDEMAARFFNGGGHKNAAGGRLECSLKEAEAIVDKAIKAYADKLK